MLVIKKQGNKTSVKYTTITNEYEKSVFMFAVETYSFVNGIGQYKIDGSEWVKNIKSVYDCTEPRTKEIIRILNKVLTA